MNDPLTYRDAGVDLDAADRAKRSLGPLLDAASDENTLSGLGAFGGLYAVPRDLAEPVLVSSADGVGTKLKVAFLTGRHEPWAHLVITADTSCTRARPFSSWTSWDGGWTGVVGVEGCASPRCENACALLGGETAQMPDFYAPGEYDLAGFVVGVVERARLVDGSAVRPGDRLVALPSSGLHTNGFTLARTIVFDRMGLGVDDDFPGEDASAGEVLLRVHRSYLAPVWPLLERGHVRAMAHVTGGGIAGNLPRVLPDGLGARIDRGSWREPNVFRQLAEGGGVALPECTGSQHGRGYLAYCSRDRGGAARLATRLECGRSVDGEGVDW